MYPKEHIVYGLLFTIFLKLIVFPTIGVVAMVLLFLSSVLIDVDHYFVHVFKNKNIGLGKAFDYYHTKTYKKHYHKRGPLMIFHTVEFVALLYLLSFYQPYFLFIIIGILFHWALDVYYMYDNKILYERTYSLIHHLATSKD